jgi:hypothetical protein
MPAATTTQSRDLRTPARRFNRVFGIGLSKTGTTTLHGAFEVLGLRSVHYPSPEAMAAGDYAMFDDLDAGTDISVTACYQDLDRRYPGSRFVLTVRALEPWLASVERHFAARNQRNYDGDSPAGIVRERVFGRRDFDRAWFAQVPARHEATVRQYFQSRPADLLVMDITAGDGWDALCPFLGLSTPAAPFPHLHKQKTSGLAPVA